MGSSEADEDEKISSPEDVDTVLPSKQTTLE
jgi:hypothetical protein